MTVSVQTDPTSALIAPKAGADPMTQLRVQAGLFGAVDGICSALTGFSPLKEWVFKPVAGDWTALDKGASAWRNAGKAAQELAAVAKSFPTQIGSDWQGKTKDTWSTANQKVVDSFSKLPDTAEQMASVCEAISEAAQAIASLIADILGQLSESLIQAAVEAAIPVVGWGAEAETAAQIAGEITEFGTKIASAITKFAALLEKLVPIVEKLLGAGEELAAIASKLASFAPKAIKIAETVAKEADTIKKVATNVEDVKKGVETAKKVVEYTDHAAEIVETSSDAHEKAEASAR